MTIKSEKYKLFSSQLHRNAGLKPVSAQIELTYRCPLHCRHCYSDCYNNRLAKELPGSQIKGILDKCKSAGVIWVCFTGGDPLMHKDFKAIYAYAKKLGFITTVFSSLLPLNQRTLGLFTRSSPFNIETTLNAATENKYREITGKNLFKNHVRNIKRALQAGIPVKVKTLITRQNEPQIGQIKKLIESLGLKFSPTAFVQARLNGDRSPCALRIVPAKAAMIYKKYGNLPKPLRINKMKNPKKLLSCAAGSNAFWVNPQGKMVICSGLRMLEYDLLAEGNTVKEGFYRLYKKAHGLAFKTKSKCALCNHRLACKWCPGKSALENGSLEKPVDYFCRLTQETIRVFK